ncbi:hypothetical protein ACDY97_34130, partial [Rhizobium mongolense]|uniref:hypothetical protein n=1 Tax=Rhizobium mongolense TaxID=57676 RepID=UPI0035571BC4
SAELRAPSEIPRFQAGEDVNLAAAIVVAGSALLLQDSGFFDGALRTDILASVRAEESLGAADFQALNSLASTQQIDPRKTAVVH